ncbi:molybdenum cofactor guanylyltransferase MobA [Serratia sp. M24T3]|uniref:Molybdenum cofactor guanylyltransferase n=1 Tax=Rouxiella sp. WC2420 TaxID=3234145 RepID=A0AB39VQ44_9GAMM|nr:molybdenum cofactor guanylyltransferase MobA [Serratia sp. M24T3]EIC82702.1 molybdopterin-guanine dinucleotide biosynthesis protein MobA [Serratia sp. M24T3]
MIADAITGVILAGGRSSRMGQDKGLLNSDGLPLFVHIARRLAPQVSTILVNSNQNQQQYAEHYPVIGDLIPGFAGPLAGMLSALVSSETEWVVCVPCDEPSLPDDLVARLWQARDQAQAVYACDTDRAHPAVCLLNKSLIPSLREYLEQGERKVMLFLTQCRASKAIFANPADFANLNTPEDLAQWQSALGKTP